MSDANAKQNSSYLSSSCGAKSIHIFMLPFFWNSENKLFEKNLKDNLKLCGWNIVTPHTTKENEKQQDESITDISNREKTRIKYNLEQYCTLAAREIYVSGEICTCYEMSLTESLTYKIEYKKDEFYELDLALMELQLYKNGIGILLFQCNNNNECSSVEDIKKINDFGRRLTLPFIPDSADGYILTGESLQIGDNRLDFREIAKLYCGQDCNEKVINCGKNKSYQFIENILNGNFNAVNQDENRIKVSRDYENGDTNNIHLFSDDRMFTMALIRDTNISKKIKFSDLENDDWRQLLYTLFYVDPGETSCQDKEMEKRLVEEASYTRWKDYGTLYGITNYSFVAITSENEGIDSSVVIPFFTTYRYMVSLVYAQRILIEKYSKEAGKCAERMHKWRRRYKTYLELVENFVSAENELLVPEFSSQQQGIEMYKMLQKQLEIESEENNLNRQLNNLYEVASIRKYNRENWLSLLFAGLAILFAFDPARELVTEILNFITNLMK